MLEEVEQNIDGETAEEVDAVGAQEGRVQGVACHLVAGPGQRAAEVTQPDPHAPDQTAGRSQGIKKGKRGT